LVQAVHAQLAVHLLCALKELAQLARSSIKFQVHVNLVEQIAINAK